MQGEFAMKNADLQLKYIELQEEHEKYPFLSFHPIFSVSFRHSLRFHLPYYLVLTSTLPLLILRLYSLPFVHNPFLCPYQSCQLLLPPSSRANGPQASALLYSSILTHSLSRLKKQMQGYELAMVEMQHRIMELQMKAAGSKK